MYDVNKLFIPSNTTVPTLHVALFNLKQDNSLYSINKQFEEAIQTYNKTKVRKKIVGYVTIVN